MNDGGWQVNVQSVDVLRRTVRYCIIRQVGLANRDEERWEYVDTTGANRIVVLHPNEQAPEELEGFWHTIPADAAPAMFAAWSRYNGGPEQPSRLRQDYDHERARVDRLTEALLISFECLPEPPPIIDREG